MIVQRNERKIALSALCSSITDGDHQAPPRSEVGIPFITISAMNAGEIDLSRATRFVPPSYVDSLKNSRRPRAGDILYSVTGSIGIPALVRSDNAFVFQRHIAILRPDLSYCDPQWLAYTLKAPQVGSQAAAVATGTAQLTVPLDGLRSFNIPCLALAEQRRIVAKLDALTARLACARRELERVRVLARNLRNASLSTARKSTLRYPAQTISQLVSVSFDGPFGSNLKSADYAERGAQVVRLENIGHLSFIGEKKNYVSMKKYADLTRHTLVAGDILFASFVDQEVRVCRLPKNLEGPVINKADCFALRVDEAKCDADFLTYILAAPETYEHMRNAVHGATRPRVGLSQLRNYPVHVPSWEQQRKIVEEIKAAFARAARMEAEAARAKKLLDRLESAIFAKAFRGELVPQNPADEPASVLLDRIRAGRAAAPKAKRGRRTAAQAES